MAFNFLPKWQHFAKSCHTDDNEYVSARSGCPKYYKTTRHRRRRPRNRRAVNNAEIYDAISVVNFLPTIVAKIV